MNSRRHPLPISPSSREPACLRGIAAAAVFAAVAGFSTSAAADEGGSSFWQPGTYDTLAAVPEQPGWSFSAAYYHSTASAGAAVAAAREIRIGVLNPSLSLNLAASTHQFEDSINISPSYVFATPVLGGQASVSVATALARSSADVSGTLTASLGPLAATRSVSISDSVIGFGDLAPQATLKWNRGTDNFMVYGTGNIPVGAYQVTRLSNLGLGHGAFDVGGGYTYYNENTGYELSAVAGLTYNLINPSTNYQSGIDFHFDWGASKYLTDALFAGPVGYFYQQPGCDGGSGDRVGCFEARLIGLGAQVGYSFPVGKLEGYLNLKGYGEFAAENRPSGWNLWLTFAISPMEPAEASARTSMRHR